MEELVIEAKAEESLSPPFLWLLSFVLDLDGVGQGWAHRPLPSCRKVYEFLSTFITSGMRFLLNQQICPVLYHAGMVLLNSLLDTVPVRSSVDELVGIDYSLLKDPVVSTSNLDMEFRVSHPSWCV
ncbi:phospholipid transfer protein-like [Marmota marmota marmota]|uniref:phospholipid transfer protein-like n=1 Tax=Marmota marmota marmota TaxID=9994 RepID=UPI00076242F7|nr:phospholipid transfer protein-like [Marmota marmota marmota]